MLPYGCMKLTALDILDCQNTDKRGEKKMRCYYHVDREGVGTCNRCGKVLCQECMNVYSPPLCTECAKEMNNQNRINLIKDIILSVAMMIVGGYLYFGGGFAYDGFDLISFLIIVFVFGGVPYGWSALNKITPDIFLIMPIIGWIIYFAIKICLSFCIGWLFFLIKIVQIIIGIRKNKGMSDYISSQNQQ